MKKLYFAFGMLLGVLLADGTGAAAAGLLAQPSAQAIYVDDERTYFTAYAIAGNNYVQLREIGRRVGFGVAYDAATDSVRISTGTPYAEQYAVAPVAQPVSTYSTTWPETHSADRGRQQDHRLLTGRKPGDFHLRLDAGVLQLRTARLFT